MQTINRCSRMRQPHSQSMKEQIWSRNGHSSWAISVKPSSSNKPLQMPKSRATVWSCPLCKTMAIRKTVSWTVWMTQLTLWAKIQRMRAMIPFSAARKSEGQVCAIKTYNMTSWMAGKSSPLAKMMLKKTLCTTNYSMWMMTIKQTMPLSMTILWSLPEISAISYR